MDNLKDKLMYLPIIVMINFFYLLVGYGELFSKNVDRDSLFFFINILVLLLCLFLNLYSSLENTIKIVSAFSPILMIPSIVLASPLLLLVVSLINCNVFYILDFLIQKHKLKKLNLNKSYNLIDNYSTNTYAEDYLKIISKVRLKDLYLLTDNHELMKKTKFMQDNIIKNKKMYNSSVSIACNREIKNIICNEFSEYNPNPEWLTKIYLFFENKKIDKANKEEEKKKIHKSVENRILNEYRKL